MHNLRLEKKKKNSQAAGKLGLNQVFSLSHTSSCKNAKPINFAWNFMLFSAVTFKNVEPPPHIYFAKHFVSIEYGWNAQFFKHTEVGI